MTARDATVSTIPLEVDAEIFPAPNVYDVEILTASGAHEKYQRIGGSILEHSSEAFHRGGQGCMVKVRKLPLGVQP